MKVKATTTGYYGGRLRFEGDAFTLANPKADFSKLWMVKVGKKGAPTPEPETDEDDEDDNDESGSKTYSTAAINKMGAGDLAKLAEELELDVVLKGKVKAKRKAMVEALTKAELIKD